MTSTATTHPLTPERWPDLERLFGERGACGGCWCMHWRLHAADYEAGKGETHHRAFRHRVDAGPAPPGVLAYLHEEPAGWCAIAPRTEFVRLERSRILAPVDDAPVWAITCFFVHRPHRGKGLSSPLIHAAVDLAAAHGATTVEAYPVDPNDGRIPPVFAYTGLATAFRTAGFDEVARRSPNRPIMRRST